MKVHHCRCQQRHQGERDKAREAVFFDGRPDEFSVLSIHAKLQLRRTETVDHNLGTADYRLEQMETLSIRKQNLLSSPDSPYFLTRLVGKAQGGSRLRMSGGESKYHKSLILFRILWRTSSRASVSASSTSW